MASSIDIVNIALSHIGQRGTVSSIDPPDDTAHSEKAARFYPIARDNALEARNWPFAIKREDLALLDESLNQEPWLFTYALPNATIRPIAVLQAGRSNDIEDVNDFVTEEQRIYTNVEDASLKYVFRQTDTTKFTPHFVDAVAWLLAHYLAGNIVKSEKVIQWTWEMYNNTLSNAATGAMAASHRSARPHKVPWINDR